MTVQKLSTALFFFLASCVHGPLAPSVEHRFSDGFWSGFSSSVVEYSRLSTDGEMLSFGTNGGRLYAVSPRDGSMRWSRKLLGSIDTQTGFGAGHIFVGTSKGRFYALREADGQEDWHYDVPGVIIGRPAQLGNTVLFGADDAAVYALDSGSGQLRWKYRRDIPDRMTVHDFAAIYGASDVAYVAFSDGTVAALKLSSGEPVWVKSLPAQERFSDVTTLLLLEENQLLAGQFDGALYSLNRNGEIEWIFPHGGSAAPPLLFKNELVVPMPGNRIAMLDPKSGTKKWEFDAKDTARWGGVTTFGSYLLASSYEGNLFVLDPAKGELKWKYNFGAPIQGGPIVMDEKAWVLTRKGRLFSMRVR